MTIGITRFKKQLAGFFLASLCVLQLSACGDKDADKRKAFGDYLQNTAMRSGIQLPALSESQKKSFGEYAGDYAILYGFSQQLTRVVNDGVRPVVESLNTIRVPQDYLTRRDDLRQAHGAFVLAVQQLQSAKNLADSSKSSLKLPDDLQKIYQETYEKTVNQPYAQLQPLLSPFQELTQSVLAVGDFLQAQHNQVSLTDNQVHFATDAQVTTYNSLVSTVERQSKAFAEAKSLLTTMQ